MRSGQRKARPGGMVEVPELPTVGRMTRRAGLGQGAIVDVIARVAGVAILRGLLEVLGHVALAAGCCYVQSEQGIGREVVVESHFAPLRRGVARLAVRAHGRTVRVGGAVTARAVGAEFLVLQ